METPDFAHLIRSKAFENVYEPAEDTFLMLDALESELNIIKEPGPTLCLEVGSGSGVVTAALSKCLGTSTFFMSTDINMMACRATMETAKVNNAIVDSVNSDMVSCFHPKINGKIDLLIFNPPYVVTPSDEVGRHGISATWAGGIDGREVIDRFLAQVPLLLSQSGVCYMVLIKENKISEIENVMTNQGLSTKLIMSRRSGPELLYILRFTRLIS